MFLIMILICQLLIKKSLIMLNFVNIVIMILNINKRQITLTEKVYKYKLKRIIDDFGNNNINQETQNNLKQYYNSLNDNGEVKVIYKQNHDIGRYYSTKFSLQNMFDEVRSSIIHKDCIDIDFKNSMITIIIYLAEKHNLKIPNKIFKR